MKGSLQLGRILGIPVRVHITFLALVAFIGFAGLMKGGPRQAVLSVVFILALFVCVLLHELAHSLVARHYGVKVDSITLLPIGGVAAMEEMPKKPSEEAVTAIVGPLASLAIAGGLAAVVYGLQGPEAILAFDPLGGPILSSLVWTNVVIAVFNLIPAFPMDGGRVLRAVLAHYIGQVRATTIAATLGQVTAVLIGLAGLLVLNNLWLALIAIFIFLGAGQESRQVRLQALLDEVTAAQAMVTRFETVERNVPLRTALAYASEGYQHDFPVVQGDMIVGVVTRQDLLNGLHSLGPDRVVGDVMSTNLCQVTPETTMDAIYRRVAQGTCGVVLVRQDDRIVGLVTPESINYHMMRAATGRTPRQGAPPS